MTLLPLCRIGAYDVHHPHVARNQAAKHSESGPVILTVTPNPSLDRTVELPAPLEAGRVQRAVSAVQHPGGKGINVSMGVHAAGQSSLAIFPAPDGDPLLTALEAAGLPVAPVPAASAVRTNTALVDPSGVTTKVNEPGPDFGPQDLAALTALVVKHSGRASWLVLAGSLPPGAPADTYPRIIRAVRAALGDAAPRIALDTSDEPLRAALDPGRAAEELPDLIKPNGEELALLAGVPSDGVEDAPPAAAELAADLVRRGIPEVLATLGGNGALLVTGHGAIHAVHAPVTVRSTVGAGDSSLAGYLLASLEGASPEARLRRAVAYGSAAASLPGTTIPSPGDVAEHAVMTHELTTRPVAPAPADRHA
ncbi:1-phosphofructokinase family hexose kinase [Falsarthrobacter nasiphocae]|uniref:1-phosphofructokinase n=1 Tax=Falsarthrobacter nasiphocae TaxID=189863 RepID=A0AAE3YEJ1_9MICC|nr:1-phosphofructokinase family hexose kinase [Falsarthrobacter nasiphocae]MDR6891944.1 1-phosphofructokinase [Falsarthrobacter nasiphocae]